MKLINTTAFPTTVTITIEGSETVVHITARGSATVGDTWVLPDNLPAGVIKDISRAERRAAIAAAKTESSAS